MTVDRWLAVIGLLFGLISIGLAFYFYKRTVKRRAPTFVVNPKRSVLVAPEIRAFDQFAISFEGKPLSEKGITSVQVYFWNSGSLEIIGSELLKPYSISIPDATILNWSVIKTNRDVIHAQLTKLDESNSLLLSFAVLEPNDGAVLQIIYDGPLNARIVFDGACVGSPRPTVLPSAQLYFSSRAEQLLQANMPILAPLVVIPIMAFFLWIARLLLSRLLGERGFEITFLFALVGCFGLAVILGLWGQFRKATAKYVPPDIRIP